MPGEVPQPEITNAQFRLLVESVREYAIFMLDPAGRVASWNSGAERIKGYARDEILGRHFSIFYEPAEVARGKCERMLEAARREGQVEDEGWRVRKGGARFWARVVITALRGTNGELTGYAKVVCDLTDRRRAEQERARLECAEELGRLKDECLAREKAARDEAENARRWLTASLRSINDAFVATDAGGRVVMMNPVAERLTGYSLAEAHGRELADVFHVVDETTGERAPDIVARVLRDGVAVTMAKHSALVSRDGARTPIADSCAPIRDEQGRWHGAVLVFRDTTDEMRELERQTFLAKATATMASSLRYEETLARIANLALPQLADWCEIRILEHGALKQVALAHSDPDKVGIARDLRERFPPDPSAPITQVARTGKSEIHVELTEDTLAAWARSPEHLTLLRGLHLRSMVVVPLVVGSNIFGAITFAFAESNRHYDERDVPFFEELARRAGMLIDNARLYGSEQHARQAADEANRAKDMFLATVSHELRTPLSAILGWARMLIRHPMDEAKRSHALGSIERSAVAMAKLIEDLLDFSRIVSGKMRIEPRVVNLAEVVGTALESVALAADAKGIRVMTAIERIAQPYVGDPARLQQIVWNLASNAVKFTPEGGNVRVTLRPKDDSVEIAVSDTGMGIAQEFLPFLFDPFRQAGVGGSRATTRGLGLGLAITKHLVELHGGVITASSEGIGKGSSFVVTLPSSHLRVGKPHKRRVAALPAPPAEPPRLDALRVLVVEDDQETRELLRDVLAQFGAKVDAVASAGEAMASIAKAAPDVLLSDIGMEGENGYDLIRRVRALPVSEGGDVAAVALTAYTRPEDRRTALEAGYTMHVPKPIDPGELARVVKMLATAPPPRASRLE